MAIKFTQETEIEKEMIELLTRGESQWTHHPEIRTEQALWDNFFDILEKNNVSRLKNVPLTDDEKSQIRGQLDFTTFYDAGVWLSGENGVAQVRIQRSDATLGTIHLMVHNANDIAGGSSVYQVINQLNRSKQSNATSERTRRMDVTLLINGIPMIHIELKSYNNPINQAFEQIKKYDAEKKFRGLMSLVQMFVISNGSDTRYIAASKHYKLDANYLNAWVDVDNKPVRDLVGFTKAVLTIPMGHELVTDYTILDAASRSLIAMRPYQIHAMKSVLDALKQDESGYIWHTTGSGKTLTSYKTAKTILRRMGLDKVLFLIDRKDLDEQTTRAFRAYSENDTVQVDDTANVKGLVDALLSPGRDVIVTTAQKLQHLLKRYERDNLSPKQERDLVKLRAIHVAFVVDECHRAVSSEQQRRIDRFFKQPVKLWYGFTGTPIFTQNKKTVKGDLDATTPDQYGRELHKYTVKEAIHDGNVLPFHVEYSDTIDDYTLNNILRDHYELDDVTIEYMSTQDKEQYLDERFYKTEGHMLQVVEQILNRSDPKLGLGNGSGQTYSGLLTVPSIERAQAYYQLFKQVLNGERDVIINDRIKKLLPDFPKIAMTYSLSENNDDSVLNQTVMAEALDDYNAMFNTNFKLETVDAYNKDLTLRLARKDEKYQLRHEQLDLVIVVDRLLTGFDAPSLSTIFIDRPIMPPHSLIQTFSRTNRLYGEKKANIVTFRTPELYRDAVRNAISLYSAGNDPDDVMAPSWSVAKEMLKAAVTDLQEVLDDVGDVLANGVSVSQKRAFAKAFQKLDKAYNDVQVYHEYSDGLDNNTNYLFDTFLINESDLEQYHGLYVNVIEQLKTGDDDSLDPSFDIAYRLSSRYREDIDYAYILSLMDRHNDTGLTHAEEKEVAKYIQELSVINPNLGKLLQQVWLDIQKNPELLAERRAIDVLDEYQALYISEIVNDLADAWLVPRDVMAYFVRSYNPNRDVHIGWSHVSQSISDNHDREHDYPIPKPYLKMRVVRLSETYIFDVLNKEVVPLKYR